MQECDTFSLVQKNKAISKNGQMALELLLLNLDFSEIDVAADGLQFYGHSSAI